MTSPSSGGLSAFAIALGLAAAAGCGDDAATGGAGGEGGDPRAASSTAAQTTSSRGASTTSSTIGSGGGMGGGGTGGGGAAAPTLFDCSAPTGAVPALKLTEITSVQCVFATSAPDDPDTLYVVDASEGIDSTGQFATGLVYVVRDGVTGTTPFLSVPVRRVYEAGLLGLAFHPDYANNGRVFVHYSSVPDGANVVQEFTRNAANPDVADAGPIGLMHTTAQTNHNGGALTFGPDGLLYLSMGDGGNEGDPECDAQLRTGGDASAEPENLLGKITRVDVDPPMDAHGFVVPAGNPGGYKGLHIGFRNPYRMAFDPCTGELFIADVGQGAEEEIDVIPAAEAPVNGGWPYREGSIAGSPYGTCPPDPGGFLEPVAEYEHTNGRTAIIGGFVYRSSTIPSLRGAYIYGDFGSGEIWYLRKGEAPVLTGLGVGSSALGGFGQDGRGNIYAATAHGLYRIDAL